MAKAKTIKDDVPKRVNALRAEINSRLGSVNLTNATCSSGVTLHVAKASPTEDGSVFALVDELVQEVGFPGLGTRWKQISHAQAEAVLCKLLHRNLAYNSERMPEAAARQIATGFLNMFQAPPVLYFTNGTLFESDWPAGLGEPISRATFDTGVVCLDSAYTGVLWVEDED